MVDIDPSTKHNQRKRECDDTVKPITEKKIPKSTMKNEDLVLHDPVQTTKAVFVKKTEQKNKHEGEHKSGRVKTRDQERNFYIKDQKNNCK